MTDHFLSLDLIKSATLFLLVHFVMSSECNLIVILGPTASGKTSLGVSLAQTLGGEILSADSRQVYRGLDIGSGKDLHEYADIPYHLIDIVDPGDAYNVFTYQRDFFKSYQEIIARQHIPIMVGGTGLYIDAIVQNYQLSLVPANKALRDALKDLSLAELQRQFLSLKPEQAEQRDLTNRPRLVRAIEIARAKPSSTLSIKPVISYPSIEPLFLGIRWPRPELRQRITERLLTRLKEGLIEEVQGLLDQGVSYETLQFYGLEYRLVANHLMGELSFTAMQQKLNNQIHQFAKRQDTWFRKMERGGAVIHWLDPLQALLPQALSLLQKNNLKNTLRLTP